MTARDDLQPGATMLAGLDEDRVRLLAELFAFFVRTGDLITLSGDLGAGKTTFARAFIRSFMREALVDPACADNARFEIPSPTFTLVQNYDGLRLGIAHVDLYRLGAPEEVHELGLELALAEGAALVEWPGQGEGVLPPATFEIAISDGGETGLRDIGLAAAAGEAARRLERLVAAYCLMIAGGVTGETHQLTALGGDASARRYARLSPIAVSSGSARPLMLMDWPRAPDGPPIRDGKPYSQIAKLAEDVRPFIAIAGALRAAGLSAPDILARDIEHGLLLLEDLGRLDYKGALAVGADQEKLWASAVDALVVLRGTPCDAPLAVGDGSFHTLPALDRTILEIEVSLVPDWLWPAIHGGPIPAAMRARFDAIWAPIFDTVLSAPRHWLLRDYHSPNLIALQSRDGARAAGIIDFQDALAGPAAYDLVSLLHDARLDVSADLELRLLERYCAAVRAQDPGFDADSEAQFRAIYAFLGAQRNTKILGIFCRLAMRDRKTRYLAHLPRIWGYLERNLAHRELEPLRHWYDEAFPNAVRRALPMPALTG